jgi:hypothetical protein
MLIISPFSFSFLMMRAISPLSSPLETLSGMFLILKEIVINFPSLTSSSDFSVFSLAYLGSLPLSVLLALAIFFIFLKKRSKKAYFTTKNSKKT